MSINQLHDDGAVIGYRPTLQYVKNVQSETFEQEQSNITEISYDYSNAVKSLINNLPSVSLANIERIMDNIQSLIDKLANVFPNGNWEQYGEISSLISALNNGDKDYASNFIKYHNNSITGSLIPELIGLIYDAQQRLDVLHNTLRELYYGNASLTSEEAAKIDDAYLKSIQSHESNKTTEQINYLTISYDSLLNRSVNMYVYGTYQKIIDVADVIFTTKDNAISDKSKGAFIEKLFGDTNFEISYRKDTYNMQQGIEIMQKTLYNYYNKRQELLELYDLFSTNNNSAYIGNKIQSHTTQLDNALANVNKAFVGNQYFLSEMAKLEAEKYFLKNLYASFNYNSEI